MGPKLTYIAAQFRVRVEFTRSDTLRTPQPPADLLARAQKKLAAEQSQGNIAFHVFFVDRLERMWSLLRNSSLSPDTVVAVTLAAGAPAMKGLHLEVVANKHYLGKLTITKSAEEIRLLRFETFKLILQKQLQEKGVSVVPDFAHIHALYLRAGHGEKILDEPIVPMPKVPPEKERTGPFDVVVNPSGSELALRFYNIQELEHERAIDEVLRAVVSKARELKERRGGTYILLKEHIIRVLRSAGRGPERYGLDLPVTLLAAIHQSAQTNQPTLVSSPLLRVAISGDGLSASIAQVDPNLYTQPVPELPVWEHWLQVQGVKFGVDQEALKDAMRRVQQKQSIDQVVVAHGEAAHAGVDPYLYEAFKDNTRKAGSLRDRQQHGFVRAGELIAEIRFRSAPVIGRAVTGEAIHPENPEIPLFTPGDGVVVKDETRFFAEKDGVPEINHDIIGLKEILVLKQNVNLSSGNVYFHGPVEVFGNIEAGAAVEVGGDLLVHGVIEGGRIKVGGNLTVDGGIVTDRSQSVIRVKGDVSANFIENTRIVAGGCVSVKKSITSSDIYAGEHVAVLDGNGLIVGGHITAWEKVVASNIGRPQGAITTVIVGEKAAARRTFALRERRALRLTNALTEAKAAFRTLAAKSAKQLSEKNSLTKEDLKQRMMHLQSLVSRAQQHAALAKARIETHERPTVLVSGTMARNCHIEMNGAQLALKEDVVGVAVVKDSRRGLQIIPISDAAGTTQKAG